MSVGTVDPRSPSRSGGAGPGPSAGPGLTARRVSAGALVLPTLDGIRVVETPVELVGPGRIDRPVAARRTRSRPVGRRRVGRSPVRSVARSRVRAGLTAATSGLPARHVDVGVDSTVDGGFEGFGLRECRAGTTFDLAVDRPDVAGVAADGFQRGVEFFDLCFECFDPSFEAVDVLGECRPVTDLGQVGVAVGQRALDCIESVSQVLGHTPGWPRYPT